MDRTTTIIFLILITFLNKGYTQQIGFQKDVITDNTNGIQGLSQVINFDIDNDGDLDLIARSYINTSNIYWYENLNGLGEFSSKKTLYNGSAESITAYDVDNDGDIDIVVSDPSLAKIFWLENDGIGNFIYHLISNSTGGIIRNLSFSDIDGDNYIDIVGTLGYDSDLIFYTGNGLGNFGPQQQMLFSAGRYKIIDIDNDNDLDLVSMTSEKIEWFENINGLYNTVESHLIDFFITSNHEYLMGFDLSDIDNDGDIDIAAVIKDNLQNRIVIYEKLNDSDNFSSGEIINNGIGTISKIKFSDIDNDGDNDIIYNNQTDGLVWKENTDFLGNFSVEQIILENDFSDISNISDIDNDGVLDFVLQGNNTITYYKNINNQSSSNNKFLMGTNTSGYTKINLGDLNGDGYLDVISISNLDKKLAWFHNNNGIIESSPTIIDTQPFYNLLTFDMDNDNDLDIIISTEYGMIWYENVDGLGNFSEQQILDNNYYSKIKIIDYDNDGDNDILMLSRLDNKIYWLENINGNLENKQILINNLNNNVSDFNVSDINGDGNNNIIYYSYYYHRIYWKWYNETNIIASSIDDSLSVFFDIDIDNDGDIDILYATDDDVFWKKNDGSGSFSDEETIILFSQVDGADIDLLIEDLDRDGDKDLIFSYNASDPIPDSLSWKENINGHGYFSQENIILNDFSNVESLYVNDINNDDNNDILISGFDEINVFNNIGSVSNQISGNVLLDIDNNGCDSTDIIVSNLFIKSTSSINEFSTFTLYNGYYQIYPNIGSFETSISNIPNYFTTTPNYVNHSFTDFGNSVNADFCLTPNQTINDVNISIVPINSARPGFNTTYQIVYKNVGTTQLNGNVILEFDDTKLSFLNASENISTQISNSLTFNYTNLNPFETRTIDLEFDVNTPTAMQPVNIGDVLSFTATVNPIIGDYTLDDNLFTLNQTVIGSFDPNDITCLEGNEILLADADKYLHYVIRFQNTGTTSSINIKVLNILDANLDWSTLQLENSSHNNRVAIKNGNEIEFIFENINLPDNTTDEPNSHGFIAYKIKPKTDIALGDIIPNKADIFFDFNAPIETNIATTTIVNALAVNENILLDFSVYPTPTENILNINSKTEIIKIEIYSKLGQLIIKNTTENKIDISNLTQGLYFVKVEDINGNFGVKKIVKK